MKKLFLLASMLLSIATAEAFFFGIGGPGIGIGFGRGYYSRPYRYRNWGGYWGGPYRNWGGYWW